MKTVLVSVLVSAGLTVAFAADPVTVSTTEKLVEALNKYNGQSQVIQLESGDYVLPGEPMFVNTSDGGCGAIYVNKVTLIGLGEKPEDVKLIGNGSIRAILAAGSAWLENLMITNGNSTAGWKDDAGKAISNSTRGGGVYGAVTVTNCVIAGCKASHGGGVASLSRLVGSRFYGNTGTYGGAVFGMSFSDCTLVGNTASEGGGAWFNGNYTVRDSRFIGNKSTTTGGGGVFQQGKVTTATNCVFSGNSAVNGGGATFGRLADATAQVELLDCIVTNNTAATGGACNKCTVRGGLVSGNTASGDGGGLYNSTAYGCLILDNTAKNGGGCHTCVLNDKCVVAGNVVTGGTGGGGLYASSAYDCVISNNFANGCSGGGVYNDAEQVVSNCTVYANRCSSGTGHGYGGGIYCNKTKIKVIDCEVTGNYAMTAPDAASNKFGLTGGVQSGMIIGGAVHDNYADSDGGGCREGIAIGCRIYNNDCGTTCGKNCHTMRLVGCDISDSLVSYGSAYGCTFHDVVSGRSHTLTNNPFKADHTYSSMLAVWNYHVNATNCLFCGNKGTMFMGTNKGGVKASLVNCTVADNEISSTFHTFFDPNNLLTVVNSAFVGNTNASGKPNDLVLTSCDADGIPGMSLANCIYGTTTAAKIADYAPDPLTLYQLGKDGIASSPRFNEKGDYPYEPKCSSPLVGRGKIMDWMTDAYDVRGDVAGGKYRRLRDGKVDIGCYQCWLDPVGMLLLFR